MRHRMEQWGHHESLYYWLFILHFTCTHVLKINIHKYLLCIQSKYISFIFCILCFDISWKKAFWPGSTGLPILQDNQGHSWSISFVCKLTSPQPHLLYLPTHPWGHIPPSSSSQTKVPATIDLPMARSLLKLFKLVSSQLFTLPCFAFSRKLQ